MLYSSKTRWHGHVLTRWPRGAG